MRVRWWCHLRPTSLNLAKESWGFYELRLFLKLCRRTAWLGVKYCAVQMLVWSSNRHNLTMQWTSIRCFSSQISVVHDMTFFWSLAVMAEPVVQAASFRSLGSTLSSSLMLAILAVTAWSTQVHDFLPAKLSNLQDQRHYSWSYYSLWNGEIGEKSTIRMWSKVLTWTSH